MVRTVESPRLRSSRFFHRDESADTGGGQFVAENQLRLADATQIQLVPAPAQHRFSLVEGIGLLLQHDAVRAIRRLFDQGMDCKLAEAAFQIVESRPTTLTRRVILFE